MRQVAAFCALLTCQALLRDCTTAFLNKYMLTKFSMLLLLFGVVLPATAAAGLRPAAAVAGLICPPTPPPTTPHRNARVKLMPNLLTAVILLVPVSAVVLPAPVAAVLRPAATGAGNFCPPTPPPTAPHRNARVKLMPNF